MFNSIDIFRSSKKQLNAKAEDDYKLKVEQTISKFYASQAANVTKLSELNEPVSVKLKMRFSEFEAAAYAKETVSEAQSSGFIPSDVETPDEIHEKKVFLTGLLGAFIDEFAILNAAYQTELKKPFVDKISRFETPEFVKLGADLAQLNLLHDEFMAMHGQFLTDHGITGVAMHELYKKEALKKYANVVGNSDFKRNLLKRIEKTSNERLLVSPPAPKEINTVFDDLIIDLPNFVEVIEHVRSQQVLRNRTQNPQVGTQALLLVGDPGIGKTYFAERLSAALSLEFHVIDMATLTAGFELTGGSAQWSESSVGRIFNILIDGRTCSPLILLDEVEKAPKGNYPAHSALFKLLNPSQSCKFIDEAAYPLEIDASKVIYVLTSNSLDSLHPAIVDRCLVFNIEQPIKEHAASVAESVWKQARISDPWAISFDEFLSEEVIAELAELTPRSMKKALDVAMAAVASRDESTILVSDISPPRKMHRKIGF